MNWQHFNLEAFMQRIADTRDCWLWNTAPQNGYAIFHIDNKQYRAHRISYELFIGEIPTGLTLDHLCRVRHCVNPTHLEPVPRGINAQRGDAGKYQTLRTHCPRGHEYTPKNTYRNKGKRFCRTCNRERIK